MLLKRHDVKVIVEMMMGFEVSDEDFVLDEINISAVCEVMNQMMGASATALSEFFGKMVNISTPVSFELKNEQEFIEKYFTDDSPWVVVSFILKIADKLESEFFNVMPMNLAKSLVKGFLPEDYDAAPAPEPAPAAPAPAPASSGGVLSQEEIERLLNGGGAAEEPAPAPTPAAPAPAPASSGGVLSQEEIERLLSGGGAAEEPAPAPAPAAPAPAPAAAPVQPAPVPAAPAAAPVQAAASPEVAQMMQMQMQMMQQMMQQMMTMQQPQKKEAPAPKTINVQPTVQKNLHQDTVLDDEQEENMELIMGVPLDISVEIGRTQKRVRDILEFTKGSLIVLDKLAGEQVDLFVNGRCIAKGDVVVVEDNFGIRITEIMKPNILSLE